ncbi:hypothetical protein K8374_01025 [Pseudomonas sp. p1(2021b)]|uniref:hypothetical protein n=1 Tax=Pseudomonas sp. p1(2021b) TaxID=2874628 RepID=UPI001CCC9ED1|nr:hypothetical protein [Pseudomonas sp. p1(2021b)]UBM25622.1 hypothetical protein K8374_01025 [Pseudomonas sp. p1(2021b)]
MNAASESSISRSAMDPESFRRLAHWLRQHGNTQAAATDPSRLLDGRYPQGLLSEAELEALIAVWH